MQESTEPLLDATNVIDPRLVVLSIILLVLLHVVVAKRRTTH